MFDPTKKHWKSNSGSLDFQPKLVPLDLDPSNQVRAWVALLKFQIHEILILKPVKRRLSLSLDPGKAYTSPQQSMASHRDLKMNL